MGAPTLSSVATSGQYADLLGAPTLSNVATSGAYADLTGAPTLSTIATSGQYADLVGAPTLSNVATSGSYNDLSDKPSIPSASTDLTDTADLARLASPNFTGTPTAPTPALGDDSTKIATTAFVQDEITNLGGVNSLDDLSDVALSGTLTNGEVLRYSGTGWVDAQLSYNDLSNTPTIPSSSDDVTSDHTGQHYTGAQNASITTHLSGIDTALGNLSVNSISAGNTSVDVTDTGADGAITFNTEGTDRWEIDANGHLLPNTNADYDIGEAENKVRHLFLSDNSLKFGPGDDSTITGTVSASGDGLSYNGDLLATQNFVGSNSSSDLSGLTDVTLSNTLTNGEVLRYSGTAWVDASLASSDLSDTADLARLASPSFTGTPTAPTPGASDNTTKIATTAYVQTEITNMSTVDALNDLSDVTVSGTQTAGEVLRYSGTGWEDASLASTDLSDTASIVRTADVGTASAENVGTAIDDVVQLEDVSGSAGLPTVDASQLTGLTASQVGALANINNESLTDLSDVNFTAGANIDGYSLVYNHATQKWEASEVDAGGTTVLLDSTNVTQVSGTNRAEVTVTAGSNYIIDPSVESVNSLTSIVFSLPTSSVSDPTTTKIINLSSLTIFVRSSVNNRLYDGLGDPAPNQLAGGMTGYSFRYTRGTVNLYQSDISSTNAKWYSYFDYTVNHKDEPEEGDGVVYSATDRAFIDVGQMFGEFLITGDVADSTLRAGRKYVTAHDESTEHTINFPNSYNDDELCTALDGKVLYIENRGQARIAMDVNRTNAPNSGYWNYFSNLDGSSGNTFSTQYVYPGELVAFQIERSTDRMYYRYIRQGFVPNRVTEVDDSGTATTISVGTEHHKVIYVENGANAVTMTVPLSADLRDGYMLTIKAIGTATVTVSRSGSNTFDAETSVDLAQYEQITLVKNGNNWSILTSDVGGSAYQPLDAALTSISGLNTAADKMIYSTGSDTYAVTDLTSAGRSLLDDADAAAQRTTLGLGTAATSASTDFLASTAGLNNLSDVTISSLSNGQVISYNSTSGEWENSTPASGGATDLNGLSDVTITSAASGNILQHNGSGQFVNIAKSAIDVGSFNDDSTYQPLDAGLTSISGLTTAANKMLYATGSDTYAVTDLTAAGRALLDDADAAAQRTTLGLGTAATAASTDFLSDVVADQSPQLGGDLDVNAHELISASNNNVVIRPNGTGIVQLGGNTNPAELRFYCESGDAHYVGLKSPAHASLSGSQTWTLPAADGTADQVLKTDGSGNLDWVDQASGGGGGGFTYQSKGASDSPVSAVAQYHYSVTGTTTITLPAASGVTAGQEVRVKNMGTDTVTVSRSSSDTIDGETSIAMAVQYQALSFVSNGSDAWEII